jgi:hypothetical protein
MFDRAELIKLAEMERRKALASENIARIRQEVTQKVKVIDFHCPSVRVLHELKIIRLLRLNGKAVLQSGWQWPAGKYK